MEFQTTRYPIGKMSIPKDVEDIDIEDCKNILQTFPMAIRDLIKNLSDEQLDTPYRKDGWSIRQVVHHCADSHMNGFIRFKLALTEDTPTIRPYSEALWAESPDYTFLDPNLSLHILENVHARWIFLLDSLEDEDFRRQYYHPEAKKNFTLRESLYNYAWHCQHHFAHIQNLLNKRNWI
ncbi:MAG: putative metal-dependent hydrolase [Crocinitomicaceae bacterium]|nr:putative metal-dependent hydrolase [Crocinitomicaceae bacterium]